MNKIFSALNGSRRERCFLNKAPAIENALSDLAVVIGMGNKTSATAAKLGN